MHHSGYTEATRFIECKNSLCLYDCCASLSHLCEERGGMRREREEIVVDWVHNPPVGDLLHLLIGYAKLQTRRRRETKRKRRKTINDKLTRSYAARSAGPSVG